MVREFLLAVFMLLLALAAAPNDAQPRLLSDAAWRADIDAVAEAIREFHPRPFRSVSADTFDHDLGQLRRDVPKLSDKEIIVRLAALVALIDDGHTRLAIPREHPELGLEFGHTPTPDPEYPALRFSQLPLAFAQFADGVHVVAASREFAHVIGHRLVAIGGTPVAEAMDAVQAICFAENSQLGALMSADRLSLPEALSALGIIGSSGPVSVDLVDSDGSASRLSVHPLPPEQSGWTGPFDDEPMPLRLRYPEKKFWSEYVADGNFVYMQMDQIADGEIPLAGFVTTTLDMAIEKNAILIIDIRNNFGGSGSLNRTLVTSIIRNDALNQRQRTFVLTGRRTFSAAQMLVNELERYTRVSFVGEPTGSRPDHFGDPKKVRLEHSGLTLRVSRLHWSSYTAFDEREATNPDFVVKWTSRAFFAGEDPALALAQSIDDVSLKTLLRAALERSDLQQVARYTLDSRLSPETYEDDFSGILLELGEEFAASDQHDIASLAYRVGLYFFPGHEDLESALEALSPR